MYRENGCMSIYIQKLVNKCTERMVVWVYIQKLVNKCT